MVNPNEDGPVSPMKRMKILSEKKMDDNIIEKTTLHTQIESFKSPQKIETLKVIAESSLSTCQNEEEEKELEPLLQENPNQYVIFPISHDDMWHMYKSLVDNFWSVTEDINQLEMLVLDSDEKTFFRSFSSIYASPKSAGLVNENFAEEFSKIINVTEARFFYGHQLFVQNIHYEFYNRLVESFIQSSTEREQTNVAVEKLESVIRKRKWLVRASGLQFGEQILASACLHGIFFSSLELVLKWFTDSPTRSSNHEIIDMLNRMLIDQQLQRDFACLMISHLRQKPTTEKIIEMINESAKLEADFLLNGVQVGLINYKPTDVVNLIAEKSKLLKQKLIGAQENKKTIQTVNNDTTVEETKISKENHYKLTFDEDF